MSRMERIKDAIASTVAKLRSEVEASHKKGRIPADYSLGFANGIIFCDHHINMRSGEPKFYDRTTSIGSLPKPVVLKTDKYGDMQGADEIFESLRDKVILDARNCIASDGGIDGLSFEKLKISVQQMDKFIEDLEEHDEQNEEIKQETDGVQEQTQTEGGQIPIESNHENCTP